MLWNQARCLRFDLLLQHSFRISPIQVDKLDKKKRVVDLCFWWRLRYRWSSIVDFALLVIILNEGRYFFYGKVLSQGFIYQLDFHRKNNSCSFAFLVDDELILCIGSLVSLKNFLFWPIHMARSIKTKILVEERRDAVLLLRFHTVKPDVGA